MLLPLLHGHAHLAHCHSTDAMAETFPWQQELSSPSFEKKERGEKRETEAQQLLQFIILHFKCFHFSGAAEYDWESWIIGSV